MADLNLDIIISWSLIGWMGNTIGELIIWFTHLYFKWCHTTKTGRSARGSDLRVQTLQGNGNSNSCQAPRTCVKTQFSNLIWYFMSLQCPSPDHIMKLISARVPATAQTSWGSGTASILLLSVSTSPICAHRKSPPWTLYFGGHQMHHNMFTVLRFPSLLAHKRACKSSWMR